MRLVKRLRRHPLTRPMAWLVQCALLAGTGVLVPAAAPAQDIEAKRAVVLDFGNTATASPLAGDEASAALSLALVQRHYEVTPRAEVQQRLKALGVRAPFEPDEIRLIKKELDIRDIFTGHVVSVDEKVGAKSSVEVLLRVEVYDGDTGDLVNGAYGRGFEVLNSGDMADREAGRASAIERAIAQCLTRTDARQLLTAAVLSFSPPNRVLVNKGRKQGVAEGMEFNVFRTKADPENPNKSLTVKVGRVRVKEASNDDATAAVVEGAGFNTHDELREVFRLPAVSGGGRVDSGGFDVPGAGPVRGGGGNASWLGPVAGVLAGVGLLGLLVVMAGTSTSDSPSTGRAGAFLTQSSDGQRAAVQVGWGDRNWAPPKRYIGGYVLYRSTSPAFSALETEAVGLVTGGNQRTWTDEPNYTEINQAVPIRYERITANDVEVVETTLDVTINHRSPQPGGVYYYKVRRIGPPMPATAPTVFQRGAAGDGNALKQVLQARAARARAAGQGKVLRSGGNIRVRSMGLPLVSHRQVVTIDPDPNDPNYDPTTVNDIPEDADVALSDASDPMGPVTYIIPPEMLAPSNNNMAQQVDNIRFQWQGELGANEYVVQIALDPQFTRLVFSSAPIATTSTGQLSFAYNTTAAGFSQLSGNTPYYWRVGARKSTDAHMPMPNGYVFGEVYSFTTADQPPPGPRSRSNR